MGVTFSSANTSANMTQDLLDSKMGKRRKGVDGPAVGKKFYISRRVWIIVIFCFFTCFVFVLLTIIIFAQLIIRH